MSTLKDFKFVCSYFRPKYRDTNGLYLRFPGGGGVAGLVGGMLPVPAAGPRRRGRLTDGHLVSDTEPIFTIIPMGEDPGLAKKNWIRVSVPPTKEGFYDYISFLF